MEIILARMKWLEFAIAAVLLSVAAWSQSTSFSCSQISLYVICDNGITANRVGNHLYFNDGSMANQVGSFTYFSDGTTANRVGTFTYYTGPVSGTANQAGSFTYYELSANDGSTVTGSTHRVGDMTFYDVTAQLPPPVPASARSGSQPFLVAPAITNYLEQQAQYQAGYAIGQKLGNVMFNRPPNMKKFCKKHPAVLINGNWYGPYHVCTADGKPK